MDVVESFSKAPVVFCVVDFEAAVGGNAGFVSLGLVGSDAGRKEHTTEAGLG
jgi:hypothetical protein